MIIRDGLHIVADICKISAPYPCMNSNIMHISFFRCFPFNFGRVKKHYRRKNKKRKSIFVIFVIFEKLKTYKRLHTTSV